MSGFIRRTAARSLDLTGYMSQSSSPLPEMTPRHRAVMPLFRAAPTRL
ncbi:hypothetical protein PC129_g21141 [Phytophthora cactorum]|uniref:Uncharacterized protein n=1 Tax=Phytophthora cactorum TaxID=29920 RepID=A0A8T0ZUC4_9STRA|nr:hypothetical protein PC112_g21788 [Phytophthora cactorum]KAG2866628.1 hypothetical protein PC113_g2653 [Phytophthora cactorum]KAG2881910.1 hypothetical protein PC114_g21317 [Phytophthora cactorum]KAG2940777.1 hypothetical protein PC115_g2363 [Phytophthora cactorum]KAG2952417.1 hypothetical protein PC117_g2822 [Phytophthora cactorum]